MPDLLLLDLKFRLSLPKEMVPQHEELKKKLLGAIIEKSMAPFYKVCCEELGWSKDVALLVKMEAENKKREEELSARIVDAEENLGEIEVREALLARATFLASIGDKEAALTALRIAADKTVSLSHRLDVSFTRARLGFFFGDHELVAKNMEQAHFQLEEGGDWDRKNRLKVYEGIHLMQARDFKGASALFLDSLATFTATELISFEDFVFLACITGLLALDRVTIKEKLIDSPEVLSVIKQLPGEVSQAMSALYNCNYDVFFSALAVLTEHAKRNHWVGMHHAFFCREMRIRAYSQLLEAYKSVTLKAMAKSFGVTAEFLDKELSRFIFSGRLSAHIDKVAGVVKTTRQDPKTALYNETLVQGDALLNRVQRLSRVANQ